MNIRYRPYGHSFFKAVILKSYPIKTDPTIPIPAPSINENIDIGIMAFRSLENTIIITGIDNKKAIPAPLIHGAISTLTNGIIRPNTK